MDHIQRHGRLGLNPFFFFLLLLGGGVFFLFVLILTLVIFADGSSGRGDGNVGLVKVEGIIVESESAVEKLIKFRKDEDVKAVIVRIDSPGGAIAPAQEIFEEIKRTAKEKPVIASMGSLAASGGYYIAAGATKIVANPGSITGSIGVIMQQINVSELARELHLSWNTIKAGKNKDIGSPLRNMTFEEKQILQGLADEMHTQFIQHMADAREMPVDEMRKLATGVIFSGAEAQRLKLVDELGGLQKALEVAGKLGEIEGDPKIIKTGKPKGFMDYLVERLAESTLSYLGLSSLSASSVRAENVYLPVAITHID